MGRLQLELSVNRARWRSRDAQALEAGEAFRKVKSTVIKRDRHTCQSCGFVSVSGESGSLGFLEIHAIDDNHPGNSPANLITLCPMCHQCFNIGLKRGHIILYPHLSQVEIIRLAHIVFAFKRLAEIRAVDTLLESQASALWQSILKQGREAMEAKYGDQSSSPDTFGAALLEMPIQIYKARGRVLADVRFLPNYLQYAEKEVPYWVEHSWGKRGLKPESWAAILRSIEARIKEAA
jgi:intracellular multiplication protein IcmJ